MYLVDLDRHTLCSVRPAIFEVLPVPTNSALTEAKHFGNERCDFQLTADEGVSGRVTVWISEARGQFVLL